MSQGGSSGGARAEGRTPIPSAENQPTVISSRAPAASSSQRSPAVESQTPAHSPERIRSGTRLGDVELLDHIGGGGMGQVYRGHDRRLNRPVAVKVMSRHQASDADTVRRFLNEARSAARLNHRNIAQVFSAGDSDSRPYIVFEFVEGSNIRSIVEQRGPLPLEEALSYTLQIADALAHAAEMRIVHRDVKPSNILIDSKGQAKLIDFGLARLTEPSPPEERLTASGVTLGTFDYISPEQARIRERRYAQRHLLARLHVLLHAGRSTAVPRKEPCCKNCSSTRETSRRTSANSGRTCRTRRPRFSPA